MASWVENLNGEEHFFFVDGQPATREEYRSRDRSKDTDYLAMVFSVFGEEPYMRSFTGVKTGRRGVRTFFIRDKQVTEAEFHVECPSKIKDLLPKLIAANTIASSGKAWPRQSDALGVDPKQVEEAQERSIKLGVPTEYDKKTGKAKILSNEHQRNLLKALGMHNRDAGYGQVTG